MSLTCSGKNNGVDIKAGEFFNNAKRCKIWNNIEQIHRSTLTKARKKFLGRYFKIFLRKL
ncbi:hypothetical protein HOB30_04250 [Candidatus Falkowbacteria bacterium]|nr:hypothetical protein [Candidatus Falkowbacteria bacterium]